MGNSVKIFFFRSLSWVQWGGGGYRGGSRKKIKGSSFVGVVATPLKFLPSCYRVKRRGD